MNESDAVLGGCVSLRDIRCVGDVEGKCDCVMERHVVQGKRELA